jgi:hypothetical protein
MKWTDDEDFADQIVVVKGEDGQPRVVTYEMLDEPQQIADLLSLKPGETFRVAIYKLQGTPRFKKGKGSPLQ